MIPGPTTRTCDVVGGRQSAQSLFRRALARSLGLLPVAGAAAWRLPARFRDARQLAPVRHGPEADPAQAELAVHGPWPPAPRAPRIGAHLELRLAPRLGDQALLRHYLALLEWEAEPSQQRTALLIGGRRGDQGDVHPALPVHLIGVDLVEHQLLGQAERVVAPAVELPVGQPAEVADPGQR